MADELVERLVRELAALRARVAALERQEGLTSPVGTQQIADGAVTTNKIADAAVTSAKIAGGPGSGVHADLLDNQHLSDLDSRYVNVSGDTMTGRLAAPSYGSRDTRDTPTVPGDYDKEMRLQFKRLSAIGLGGIATGTYCQLLGYRAWMDDTGGNAHELAFTDDGIVFYRSGTEAGGWGNWRKIWHSGNVGSGSGLDADSVDGKHLSEIKGVGAIVKRTTNQTIPDDTATVVSFDTELVDIGDCFNSGQPDRITVPTSGVYYIWGQVRWQGNTNGVRDIHIRVAGTDYISMSRISAQDAANVQTSAIWYLQSGQIVQLTVYQTSGGNLNLEPYNGQFISLGVFRLY